MTWDTVLGIPDMDMAMTPIGQYQRNEDFIHRVPESGLRDAFNLHVNPEYGLVADMGDSINAYNARCWGRLGYHAMGTAGTIATAATIRGALGTAAHRTPALCRATQDTTGAAVKAEPIRQWFPKRELPRNAHSVPVPKSSHLHTQPGWKSDRNGDYPQTRELGPDEQPIRGIDFTDHGLATTHLNPHQHSRLPNEIGGTPRRTPAETLQ